MGLETLTIKNSMEKIYYFSHGKTKANCVMPHYNKLTSNKKKPKSITTTLSISTAQAYYLPSSCFGNNTIRYADIKTNK